MGDCSPSSEQPSSWSEQANPQRPTHQQQRFETSLETPTVRDPSRAPSVRLQEADLTPAPAAPALTPSAVRSAESPDEGEEIDGSRLPVQSARYPTTTSRPLADVRLTEMPLKLPIVLDRAVQECRDPFGSTGKPQLEHSERHSSTALLEEPGPDHESTAEYRLLPSLRPSAGEPQCDIPPAPDLAAQAAQARHIVDFVHVALHPQAGMCTGFRTGVDATNLGSSTGQFTAHGDGFSRPPGDQSTLAPRLHRPLARSALQSHPARTSDLSMLSQLGTSPTHPISKPLIYSQGAMHPVIPSLDHSNRKGGVHSLQSPSIQHPLITPIWPGKEAPQHRGHLDSWPASPQSDEGSTESDYDTPMTSPCCSPVKDSRAIHQSLRLTYRARQYDGAGPSNSDDEITPSGPASPAKAAKAFPFPSHAEIEISTRRLSTSRRPSALLRQCERDATPRQRRVMASGLQTPDRFVPRRPSTPAKETLLLARTKARTAQSGKPILSADPFGPLPTRSLRMVERHTTARPLPTASRSVGTSITRVHDAQGPTARAASAGTVWTVGGSVVTEGVASCPDGRGGRVTSGTSASHYTADFLRKHSPSEEEVIHGRRLAVAMDIDQSAKMLDHSLPSSPRSPHSPPIGEVSSTRTWNNGVWEQDVASTPIKSKRKNDKDVPIIPFRVLDAPALRDDYYCSLLAYSTTLQCLAVGLGPHVYLWSENRGAKNIPDSLTAPHGSAHVTSVSFSSRDGGSAIVAIGRADGRITLWSPLDPDPRFDSEQPAPVSYVCFRPNTVRRPSLRNSAAVVATEELLVGDEVGHVYYYSIQWPTQDERDLFDWHGSMTLLARINCHSQQVCGIAWCLDGGFFATGGNDNQMFLFDSKRILKRSNKRHNADGPTVHVRDGSSASSNATTSGHGMVLTILPGREKHIFNLNAAVKAIAFAPWQSTLLAAGGGSNDRCIHFFHTLSGANLATIECHAQVTSLVWSEKRQEIAGTFGFAQPEHPYRVAVFAWPSCDMVVRIPWWSEERALYAVAYPRGPRCGQSRDVKRADSTANRPTSERRLDTEGRPWYGKRTKEEGCLVVATSDASIKFHEIWTESRSAGGKRIPSGVLGGSQILEAECSGDIERWTAIR